MTQNLHHHKMYTKVILCAVGGQMLQCKVFSCEMLGGQSLKTRRNNSRYQHVF